MENVKKYFLGFCTFLCIVVLTFISIVFALKNISQKYVNEKKINSMIDNIKITEILNSDNNEQFNEIKNKLIESGINKDKINNFIETDTINKYAGEKTSEAINNVLNNKNDKLLDNGEIYVFFNNNISKISNELEEKGIIETGIVLQRGK